MPIPRLIRDRVRAEIEQELDRWVARIVSEMRPDRIILFGSAARGEAGEDSDIDIVVIAESEASFFDRIGQALDLYEGKREVQALVYTPAEWGQMLAENRDFALTVVADGQVLYDRSQPSP